MAKTTAAEDVLLFWPNLIGYSRVILMLAFFGLAKVNWQYAIICYCLSFAGDVVDGYVARYFNQSKFSMYI